MLLADVGTNINANAKPVSNARANAESFFLKSVTFLSIVALCYNIHHKDRRGRQEFCIPRYSKCYIHHGTFGRLVRSIFHIHTQHIQILIAPLLNSFRATGENRTLVNSLEDYCFTIKLRSHFRESSLLIRGLLSLDSHEGICISAIIRFRYI